MVCSLVISLRTNFPLREQKSSAAFSRAFLISSSFLKLDKSYGSDCTDWETSEIGAGVADYGEVIIGEVGGEEDSE